MGVSQSSNRDAAIVMGPAKPFEQGLSLGACGLYDFSHLLTKPSRQKRKFSNSSVTISNDDRNEKFTKIIKKFLVAIREVTISSAEMEKMIFDAEVSFDKRWVHFR